MSGPPVEYKTVGGGDDMIPLKQEINQNFLGGDEWVGALGGDISRARPLPHLGGQSCAWPPSHLRYWVVVDV